MSTESVIPQTLPQLERVPCNICGSNQSRLVFEKSGFPIVECVECGLVYVNPRSFRVEEDGYFEGPYLSAIEQDGRLDAGTGTLYDEILYNLGKRVGLGKLLDVGCAMGHFLGFAKSYGWEVEGVECSPFAARYAEKHFGAKVHPVCVLKDAHLSTGYNSCVLLEVMECLPDPRGTMTEVWRLLRPGGLVYLTAPNFTCYRSLLLQEEWTAVIPARHLYHFDSSSLRKLLSSIGFINVENLTGPADFSTELDFAEKSGKLKLGPEELGQVKELARLDAQKGPANGRGECLVICARKPWDATFRQFEGCLVRRPGETPEDHKVYFVENGRKRWVTTADWIIARGMNWPGDMKLITAEELDTILPGPPLP